MNATLNLTKISKKKFIKMNQLVTAHKILTFTNNTLGNNQAVYF